MANGEWRLANGCEHREIRGRREAANGTLVQDRMVERIGPAWRSATAKLSSILTLPKLSPNLAGMIAVNMREAKSRLPELVKAVEAGGEIVLIQRNGIPIAEIRALSAAAPLDRTQIAPIPRCVWLVAGHDPAEPLNEDEWPSELR